ncbi:MAG: hypothetical protein RIS36_1145 [Pseudomonadota bacterium]
MTFGRKSFFTRKLLGVYLLSMTRAHSSIFFACRPIILGAFLLTTGCSEMAPQPLRTPEPTEKIVFNAMSSFYCAERRWPKSWDELAHFDRLSPEGHHAVGEILTPELSSPRAILLVVRYTNAQGLDRRVVYIAPPECDDAKGSTRVSTRVSMAGGRVSFDKIPGFSQLDGAAVKAKWKDGPYPDVAWQDPSRGIFVTVRFGEVPITPQELPALQEELEGAYESSLRNLTWIERRVAADEEPPKLVHILSSDTSSGTTISYTMSMSFDGRLLTISVSGPAERERGIEQVARSLRRSLRLW